MQRATGKILYNIIREGRKEVGRGVLPANPNLPVCIMADRLELCALTNNEFYGNVRKLTLLYEVYAK